MIELRLEEFGLKSSTFTYFCRKFSDLESVLLGLDLAEYLPLFQSHKVASLDTFLCLAESDLEAMGVSEVGARKKIADGIFSIHKKDWEVFNSPFPISIYSSAICPNC